MVDMRLRRKLQLGRMIYLSQVINKKIFYHDNPIGKVIDVAVTENKQTPLIAYILVKNNQERFILHAGDVKFSDNVWKTKGDSIGKLPAEESHFYLAEDLLDKQVIDINGKRLVRVNDILLKDNGELKVEGIDIGFSGVLRRLGFGVEHMRTMTLPWSLIEAFDYQTGNVQLKLTQSKLNTFHPAELADILEEAGTKERLGVVSALEASQAANAIAEADEETQSAILEQVPTHKLKKIVDKMHSSVLADVIDKLNPFTSDKIFETLESEKAKKVKKLLIFEDDEAGGLMDFSFFREKGSKTIGETLEILAINEIRPEVIIVIDADDKILGTVPTKTLINRDKETKLQEFIKDTNFVYEDAPFSQILRLFAEYNLRLLPVVDAKQKVIGAITIDHLLAHIQEEEEKEDAV
jgi:magnesium transporter